MRKYATEIVAVAFKNKHITNSQCLGELFITLRHFHQASHRKTPGLWVLMIHIA